MRKQNLLASFGLTSLAIFGIALGTNSAVFANATSEQIGQDLRVWGSSFKLRNHSFGSLLGSSDSRQRLIDAIENDTRQGIPARDALDTAFGSYVDSGVSRYGEQGQTLKFDPAFTKLDPSIAMYKATQGSDVPALKSSFNRGTPYQIFIHLDQDRVTQLKASVGTEKFEQVYGNEADDRTPNPVSENFVINNQEDADNAQKVLREKAPWLTYVGTFNPGTQFELQTFDSDPKAKILMPSSNHVMIEYAGNNQAFQNNSNYSAFYTWNGRSFRIFKDLEEITDDQLRASTSIHLPISQFVDFQNRVTEKVQDRQPENTAGLLTNLERDVFMAVQIPDANASENAAAPAPSLPEAQTAVIPTEKPKAANSGGCSSMQTSGASNSSAWLILLAFTLLAAGALHFSSARRSSQRSA